MTLPNDVDELTRAVLSLTDVLTAVQQTLDGIKSELQWANNNGPTYTTAEDPRGEVD